MTCGPEWLLSLLETAPDPLLVLFILRICLLAVAFAIYAPLHHLLDALTHKQEAK